MVRDGWDRDGESAKHSESMKSGICPKCNAFEVYGEGSGTHGISVDRWAFIGVNTILLVCANCGYLEFYVENEKDLETVKKRFQKIES